MAFSFFGKKSPEPAKTSKPAAKTAAAESPKADKPRAPAESTPAPAEKKAASPAHERNSLDFTNGSLDDPGKEDEIEISHSSGSHPVVEEAAILYANGQDAMALAALEGAVGETSLGAATEQVWAMLFDLCMLMGKRETFESRALEYSLRFEKSPPAWQEVAKERVDPTLTTGGLGFVAFGTALNAQSEKSVRQLERIIANNPTARAELGKIRTVDEPGCSLLLQALKLARKDKCEVVLTGAEELATVLGRKAVPGTREHEAAWLLLLELFQHLGRQEDFDDMALQYAITFEVSPPSWETQPAALKKKPAAPKPVAEISQCFPMPGEVFSGSSETFNKLNDYAQSHSQVVIDCSALKRMDFVSAGTFLNVLLGLQVAGKSVLIRSTNAMVFALFGVLGIQQIAQVERRKI